MFSDALLALHEVAPDANISYMANLELRGLPKVRRDAERIIEDLNKRNLSYESIGALDEYGANGDRIGAWLLDKNPDFALISGVPHAIPQKYTDGIECFSITNGPRQVAPLKEIGHAHVVVEIDLHPKTIGIRNIIESEFGAVLRSFR